MRPLPNGNGLGRPLLVDSVMGEPASKASAFALPAGTVTFLLTDIEGSTRLWETARDAMPRAVARHYEILDEAIARHGGVRPVEQGEGDSVVAAFTRAADALAASLDAQRALLRELWPEGAELRVRMALHTGDARLRDEGNYFGAAVNRCARLRAIAHGGHVLLSQATHELVEDGLPDGVELADLGVHRLRDLGRPEHVFALAHRDLPAVAEPLRSLDVLPNNLPVELSSFVGRVRELAEVSEALAATRALTLTGAGGCGKTRLALQATADSLDRYPDGAWWVELAPLTDPRLLDDALATAVGVRPLPGQTPIDATVAHLANKRALVVLDNCEHLLETSARLAESLLRGCPDLTVLVTSREPLGLSGETSWLVPSLSLPPERAPEPAESLAQSDAVRLFIERAAQVRPNFEVTTENAPAVAQICHDLDGIPLAIELAAARVRMLSVEQIAAGLADRFRLLTGGVRTALARQQTLRASVDWSHELLSDPERLLLRRLGVFAGGFTLDSCEQVCAGKGLDRYAILDLLTSLVDKSLVLTEEHGPLVRYRLHETVRHYALDRLLAAGETQWLRDSHRDALLALAEAVEPQLLSEREPEALDLLDAESANLHAAIEWATQTEPELALRLCTALTLWWRLRGRFSAADAALARAIEVAPVDRPAERARALWARAYLAVFAADYDLVQDAAGEALAIGEELGDEWIQGRALHALAYIDLVSNPRAGIPAAERSRELARAAGDDFVLADATQVLSFMRWMQDDDDAARRESEVCFKIAERIGNRDIMAFHWLLQAITPWGSAEFDRRRSALERCLATSAEVGDPVSDGFGTAILGLLEIQAGVPGAAIERLERGRERVVAAGAGMALACVEQHIGLAQAALGRIDDARAVLADVVERQADGYSYIFSLVLSSLAGVDRLLGQPASARAHAERALETAGHVGSPMLAALARHELGRLAAARGEWAEAEHLLQDALGALVEGDQAVYVPDALEALAEVAAGLESHEEAARLLAAAGRARRDLKIVRWIPEHERWNGLEEELREALGDAAYEAAAADGGALTMTEAVAYVRRARGSRKRPPGGWGSLTPTELQVARHVAAGLTNPEIGKRMFISRGTAKVHLSHIYAKLGLRNRAELTAEVTRREGAPRAQPPTQRQEIT